MEFDYNKKKVITDLDVNGKKALVRVDFNVPLKDGVITDDTRIKAALPTIKHLVEHDAKVILFSHLGRIKTNEDKKTKSLAPIAKRLSELMNQEVVFVPVTRGVELENAINALKPGQILLVQNTRFEDVNAAGEVVKFESKNNPELGKYWASLGDLFINDAFGTAHRAHASNVGIAENSKESALGFLVEKELTMLSKGCDNPTRPMIAVLGGAKVSDKIGVIDNLLNKVDKILIGGGMAYTFFAAQGHSVGKSLLEVDKIPDAKAYLEKAKGKIILPVDSANAPAYEDVTPSFSNTDEDMPADMMGLDIGPKTIELFKNQLAGAKTVVWNGPMGVFEFENFKKGTLEVGKAIANLSDAFTLIGGGDSAAAAEQLGLADKFSWISTGGGASLTYMEGKALPGIEAIQNK